MNAFPVTRRSRGLHVRAGVRVVANVGSTWFWGGTEPHVGRGVRPGTRATHCGREQGLSAERREEPKPAPRSRARGAFVPPCSLRRCGRRAARRPSRNPPLLCGGPRGPWAHSRPSLDCVPPAQTFHCLILQQGTKVCLQPPPKADGRLRSLPPGNKDLRRRILRARGQRR